MLNIIKRLENLEEIIYSPEKPCEVLLINQNFDFKTTLGYIQYTNFVLQIIQERKYCKNKDMQKQLETLANALAAFTPCYTLLDTSDLLYGVYGEEMSYISDTLKTKALDTISTYLEKIHDIFNLPIKEPLTDIIPHTFMSLKEFNDFYPEHSEDDTIIIYPTSNDETLDDILLKDLMNQLNRFKISKTLFYKEYNFQNIFIDQCTHDIACAMNTIIQAIRYSINCYSFKNKEAFYEDILQAEEKIQFAKNILNRVTDRKEYILNQYAINYLKV